MRFRVELGIGLSFVIGMLLGCAINRETDVAIIAGIPDPQRYGGTTCDYRGHEFIFLTNEIPNPLFAEAVIAHEMTHIRQIRRHAGGCQAFQIHYRLDSDFRLQSESEAHCVDIEYLVARGGDRPSLVAQAVQALGLLGTELSAEELPDYLPCREAPKEVPNGKPRGGG